MVPHSHDLRSVAADPESKWPAYYQRRLETGLCVSCGKIPVLNRAYCYQCSHKQSLYTYRSGLRHFLRDLSIDPVLSAVTLVEMKEKCQNVEELELLDKFSMLLFEAMPQR